MTCGVAVEEVNLDTDTAIECFPKPPAPPASEELSSGAIGGIVVGSLLGVAAIGGATAAYRGVAAGV